MSGSPDLFKDAADNGPSWPEVRAWIQAHPDTVLNDRALLEEVGLRPQGRNIIDFSPAALTRLEAVVEREADARKHIEGVARANFAAQTQTHVAALDLLEARDPADLARRLDAAAQGRFGLVGAAIALERPGPVPFGWRGLEPGRVDALLGDDGLAWLGPYFDGVDLFGPNGDQARSVALIRMSLHLPADDGAAPRPALCAFASAEPEGFTPAMGCELIAFLARVTERVTERMGSPWPPQV